LEAWLDLVHHRVHHAACCDVIRGVDELALRPVTPPGRRPMSCCVVVPARAPAASMWLLCTVRASIMQPPSLRDRGFRATLPNRGPRLWETLDEDREHVAGGMPHGH